MKNIFNAVAVKTPGSNYFDLSHQVKTSFRMGHLVPTFVADVLPGDKFNISVENLLRFAPLISPVMHRVNITTHFFFVPNRILWDDFTEWIAGNVDLVPPFVTVDDTTVIGDLPDYLGYPPDVATGYTASAFPIAAYALIYDEYYRDQNLQTTDLFEPLVAGDNTTPYGDLITNSPRYRAWNHDYFTSALPFAQKGDSALVPLGNFSDVDVELDIQGTPNAGMQVRDSTGAFIEGFSTLQSGDDPDGILTGTAPRELAFIDPNGNLKALTSDLEAQAADINSLRRAFALQTWLETNARAGTRYNESVMAHFGARVPDARINRPEYLGGAFQTMTVSEVLSTAQDTGVDGIPVGNMAGHGISYGKGQKFNYTATEHGWIMGIVNVQPVTAYQQGVHRSLLRTDRLDYAWPVFANIGEQPIYNIELYADQVDQDGTFGYIPRYSEYKFMNDRVSGEFRDTLNFWHLGRIFSSAPSLNESFVRCDPSDRIFAVQDGSDHIFALIRNNCGVVRKLPKFGIPQF